MGDAINVAIMQPYFLPYIGYWQLVNAVDKFVVYDNIEYTKKGWINRNRLLQMNKDELFTIPLKKDSDYLHICNRYLSDNIETEQKKLLRKFENAYRKAPYFNEIMPVFEQCVLCNEKNLFAYIYNSIEIISKCIGITTDIVTSSQIEMDHSLKSQDRVIEICKHLNASSYVNPIGGLELYDKETFDSNGIELKFIKSNDVKYKQFNNDFVPWLSIIDVMMFNSKDEIQKMLNQYKFVWN